MHPPEPRRNHPWGCGRPPPAAAGVARTSCRTRRWTARRPNWRARPAHAPSTPARASPSRRTKPSVSAAAGRRAPPARCAAAAAARARRPSAAQGRLVAGKEWQGSGGRTCQGRGRRHLNGVTLQERRPHAVDGGEVVAQEEWTVGEARQQLRRPAFKQNVRVRAVRVELDEVPK
jgi:hypothetical protein